MFSYVDVEPKTENLKMSRYFKTETSLVLSDRLSYGH